MAVSEARTPLLRILRPWSTVHPVHKNNPANEAGHWEEEKPCGTLLKANPQQRDGVSIG